MPINLGDESPFGPKAGMPGLYETELSCSNRFPLSFPFKFVGLSNEFADGRSPYGPRTGRPGWFYEQLSSFFMQFS